jgi:hypothetical protein
MGTIYVDAEPVVPRKCTGEAGFVYVGHFKRDDYSGGMENHTYASKAAAKALADAAVTGGSTWTTAAAAELGSLWSGWSGDERDAVRAAFIEVKTFLQ